MLASWEPNGKDGGDVDESDTIGDVLPAAGGATDGAAVTDATGDRVVGPPILMLLRILDHNDFFFPTIGAATTGAKVTALLAAGSLGGAAVEIEIAGEGAATCTSRSASFSSPDGK